MKLTLTILSVTGLVAAQGYGNSSSASSSATNASASASASATPSSNIPPNISSGCSNFLSALNIAPGIQSCILPALNTLQSNNALSVSSVCAASSSSGCSDSTIRAWLMDFRGNCTNELLTSPNQNVVAMYSTLYAIKPFLNAVCSKDISGSYCLSQLGSNSTAKAASGLANAAQQPLVSNDGTPDAEAFSNAHVLFLGANPSMNATSLCTTCTKNVLTSYINWETSSPSALSLSSLPMLASQQPLWAAVQKTCPANFMSGALVNAGTSPAAASGASTSSPAKGAMMMLVLVAAGVMTL